MKVAKGKISVTKLLLIALLFLCFTGFISLASDSETALAAGEQTVSISGGQGTKQDITPAFYYKLEWETADKFAINVAEGNAKSCNYYANLESGAVVSDVVRIGVRDSSVSNNKITCYFNKSTVTGTGNKVSVTFTSTKRIIAIGAYNATPSRKYGGTIKVYRKDINGVYQLRRTFSTQLISGGSSSEGDVPADIQEVAKLETKDVPTSILIPKSNYTTRNIGVFITDTFGADYYSGRIDCGIYYSDSDSLMPIRGVSLSWFLNGYAKHYIALKVENDANFNNDAKLKFRLRVSSGSKSVFSSVITLDRSIYRASFDNGGIGSTSPAAQPVVHGQTPIFPTLSADGYTFNGWSDSTNGSVFDSAPVITSDKNFYAQWTPNNYSVTLNTNGGTINSGNVTSYTYGVGAKLPSNVTKTGCTFNGWYTADSGGDKVTEISAADLGDKILYARWTSNNYSVTLNTNGGTINSGAVSSYTYGTVTALPTDVTKTGYNFEGWFTAAIGGYKVTEIAANVYGHQTYYAKWTPKNYTVTLETYGGTIETGGIRAYAYGTGVTLPVNVIKSGYKFVGWYTAETGGNKVTAITAEDIGDKTFFARYEILMFGSSFDANGYAITDISTIYLATLSANDRQNIAIVIPDTYDDGKNGAHPVVAIGADAFNMSKKGSSTYQGCTFTSLDLSGATSLKTIGANAFLNCSGIKGRLTLPSVITIGEFAFYGCSGFTGSLTIPDSVITIGQYALQGCAGFTGVLRIPDSVATIGSMAFSGCGLTTVYLSNNANADYHNCFDMTYPIVAPSKTLFEKYSQTGNGFTNYTNLTYETTVTFDGNGGTIGADRFVTQTKLFNYDITMEKRADGVWAENTAYSLPIAGKTNHTFVHWFGWPDRREDIIAVWTKVTDAPTYYAHFDIIIFKTSYDSISGGYTINGFSDAYLESLTADEKQNIEIVIPATYNDGINGVHPVETIGPSAFQATNETYADCRFIYLDLFDATNLKVIGLSAFDGCASLKVGGEELIIPVGVTTIGRNAFCGCTSLLGTLKIPDSVEYIGAYAFYNCKGLTGELRLPANVNFTELADYVFWGCNGFTGPLTITKNIKSIGNNVFLGCVGFTRLEFETDCAVESVGDYAFSGCSGLTGALTIPDSVAAIGASAFNSCSNLQTIYLPNNTSGTTYGSNVFSNITCPVVAPNLDLYNAYKISDHVLARYNLTYETIVVFDGNEGSVTGEATQTKLFGLSAGLTKGGDGVWATDAGYSLPQANKTDYRFAGWNVKSDGSGSALELSTAVTEAQYYAQYTEILASISLIGAPEKTAYIAYELFDPTGLTVTAYYQSGAQKTLSNYEYSVIYANSNSSLGYGDDTVTISYEEYGVTKTASVTGLSVSKKVFGIPVISGSYVYDGSEKTVMLSGFDSLYMTAADNTRTDAGEQNVGIALKDTINCQWSDGTTGALSLKWTIETLKVTAPAADSSKFIYTGNEQTYAVTASDYYTIAGNKRTNAGTTAVTIVLKDKTNYEWTTGGVNDISFDWTIETLKVIDPTADTREFVYNGQQHTYMVAASDYYSVTGYLRTNAGKTDVTIVLRDKTNYEWKSGGSTDISFDWTIEKMKVTAPAADTSTFTYTGQELTYSVSASDYYTVTGNKRTNAGQQKVTVTLKDKANTEWESGGSTDISFDWNIAPAKIAKPAADTTEFTFNGLPQIYNLTENAAYTIDGNVETDAGNYKVTVSLNNPQGVINYEWSTGGSADEEYQFIIAKKAVSKPSISGTYVYGGEALTANVATTAEYNVTGNRQIDAGEYVVTVTLTKNYKWSDGDTATAIELKWSIAKKKLTISPVYDTSAQVFVGGSLPAVSTNESTSGAIAWDTPIDLTAPAVDKGFGWTWTPTDTKNYETIKGTVNFDVIAVELASIEAVFAQGSNAIYTSNAIDSLRSYLTVIGTNNDGSPYSDAIEYELSGTLTAGTALITVTVTGTQISDRFAATVTAVELERISASFTQGEIGVYTSTSIDSLKTLLETALVVTKHYNDGSEVSTTDYRLSGDLTLAGTTEITVTAENKTAEFTLTVTAVALESISADFDQGEIVIYTSLAIGDLKAKLGDALIVTGTNNDGSSAGTFADFMLSRKNGTAFVAGNNAVVVSYGGKTTEIAVSVTAVTLESITASFEQGQNKVYPVTTLDTLEQWLTVMGTNNDGSSAGEISEYKLSGLLEAGTPIVTVTVKGTSIFDRFQVRVTAIALESIAVTTQPNRTRYTAFDDFDHAGMAVTATFNYGTEIVTDYRINGKTNLQAGTNELLISYAYGDTVKETSVSISVAKLQIKKPRVIPTEYIYDGTEQTFAFSDVEIEYVAIENDKRTIAGEQEVWIRIKDTANCEWEDGDIASYKEIWKIETLKITVPTADNAEFTYTGRDQTYTVASSDYYTITGNKRTNAGQQKVTVSLKDKANTEWKSGGMKDILFTFTIAKADYDMGGVAFADRTVKEDGQAHKIEASGLPDGVAVAAYTGTNGYTSEGVGAAGVYEITAVFSVEDENNFNVPDSMKATLTVNRAQLAAESDEGDGQKETVVVETEEGIAPDVTLNAKDVTETEHGIVVTEEDREVKQVFEVGLFRGGTEIQPSGDITIRLLIAPNLRGSDNLVVFDVGEDGALKDVNAVREGDYMVFTVSGLAKFAIVGDVPDTVSRAAIAATVIFWILALGCVGYIIYYYRRKKNGKDDGDADGGNARKGRSEAGTVKTYSFAPFLLTAVIVPAGLIAALVAGIAAFAGAAGFILVLHGKDGTLQKRLERIKTKLIAQTAGVGKPASGSENIYHREDKQPPQLTGMLSGPDDKSAGTVNSQLNREDRVDSDLSAEVASRFGGLRYRRSFLARIIQGSEDNKRYYGALKNELLSYKKVRSSISFAADTFTMGRERLAKIVVAGKTLRIYLAIDPATADKKFCAVDASDVKKYAKTPCCLKVKSDIGLKKALYLADVLMRGEHGVKKPDFIETDYVSAHPYEDTETLIGRGLIKKLAVAGGDENVKADISELIRNKISLFEAQKAFSDEVAAALVENIEITDVRPAKNKNKAVVNIDTLSEHFEPYDLVNLDALKEKGIVARNAACVKILARGVLDKPLTVEAHDFSLDAVRMIALTGGKAVKLLRK